MAELKTKANDARVGDFINSLSDPQQQTDSLKLIEVMSDISNASPVMWGGSIIGFGTFHYKSERSSQEGDWPIIAFSPRKGKLSLYITFEADKLTGKFPKLGKYKTGKGCIYINKLSDVDAGELKKMIKTAWQDFALEQSQKQGQQA